MEGSHCGHHLCSEAVCTPLQVMPLTLLMPKQVLSPPVLMMSSEFCANFPSFTPYIGTARSCCHALLSIHDAHQWGSQRSQPHTWSVWLVLKLNFVCLHLIRCPESDSWFSSGAQPSVARFSCKILLLWIHSTRLIKALILACTDLQHEPRNLRKTT